VPADLRVIDVMEFALSFRALRCVARCGYRLRVVLDALRFCQSQGREKSTPVSAPKEKNRFAESGPLRSAEGAHREAIDRGDRSERAYSARSSPRRLC